MRECPPSRSSGLGPAWRLTLFSDDNQKLDFQGFKSFLQDFRTEFGNRKFVSQTSVVVPNDPEGKTGVVGDTTTLTAVKGGQEFLITIFAIVDIGLSAKGERQVEMENFIIQERLISGRS